MIKKVFAVTPKYKEITKGRTHYTNDNGDSFALTRLYNSLSIKMINLDATYEIEVDDLIMGENIRGFLGYRYPGTVCEILMTDFCGIDFSYDMPDDVRKKLTADPEYDLDDDGWITEDIYYDFDSGSDYADEVLVYTPFVVTLLKSVHIDNSGDEVVFTETMVDKPPLPIERPTLSFSMEESSWDDMKWE
jgi:hypothetical protein